MKLWPGCFSVIAALTVSDAWPSGCQKEYVALSPAAVVVPAGKAFAAAQYYASLRPNAMAVTGVGDGMMPLYSSGTVLVIDGVDYSTLHQGMTVMFRNHDGFRVTHFLVKLTPDGWVTFGLNQRDFDPTPVTRQNYLGVVVMAFKPESPPASSPSPAAAPSPPL
jgi:hypothetical protein